MAYKKEQLEEAAKICFSFSEMARTLGRKPVGGTTTNLRRTCAKHGVDTSHFTGQGHNKGKRANNCKTPTEILVLDESQFPLRPKRDQLHRALGELGIPYKCSECGISEWNGKTLSLDIDHISGEYWDSRKENLRYLCPNCHRQTETWGKKSG